MLGDQSVLGRFYANIDDKNRLCIPAKSGIEAGEELIIVIINGSKCIVDYDMFKEYLAEIKERVHQVHSVDEFKELMRLHDYLCSCVVKKVVADKLHRIPLSGVYEPKDGKAELVGIARGFKLI